MKTAKKKKKVLSMYENITKEEVNQLPQRSFPGKIVIISNDNALDEAIREISEFEIVGFDTEKKPNFRRGENNGISILQIAIPEKVFVIKVKNTGLTHLLLDLFENRSIKKIGIGIKDDLINLKEIHPFDPESFVDLNTLVKKIGVQCSGARRLTGLFLNFRISKRYQTSNWEQEILSEGQLKYAATDAWVCLKIYKKLQQLELIN